jgi:hypothetical protein
MKYEKPIARNLSDISFVEGTCFSGAYVGTCYSANGLNAGLCTNGRTAGFESCITGLTPADTCFYGGYGYYHLDCISGGIAKGG